MEESQSNARRFITAYNTIDQTLRSLYDIKRSLSFSDVIHKCVQCNFVIRKYEDKLIDFGRLRNAIIHRSNEEYIIAEPHIEVVMELEKIAKLISTPPTAIEYLGKENLTIIDADATLFDAIMVMSEKRYSNLPVYRDNLLIGVLKGQRIVEHLGDKLSESDINIDKYLKQTKIGDIIEQARIPYSYFSIKSEKSTIADVLEEFNNNRKLIVIILTKNGLPDEQPLSIITTGDIIEFNKVLDNY